MKVGLTGGIGSGKSAVARCFREKGAYVVDFDHLAHMVQEPGSAAWDAIVESFGRQILNEDGTINRRRLGEIVFRDRG
ncbi:MAG: dephospho-CoA kinase, partial [Deltaproteobacteria bacterium]|nr:dephospho-CoA kinase [Deltaproteobacteria bacterium]